MTSTTRIGFAKVLVVGVLFFSAKCDARILSQVEPPLSPDCAKLIDGGGWELVRHVPASAAAWHPSTDRLAGTESYGTRNVDLEAPAWSVPFSGRAFDHFLFATGDCAKWLIATPEAVTGATYADQARDILKSSISPDPYQAKWYNRDMSIEDPWLSLTDHSDAIGSNNLVYGENGFNIVSHTDVLTSHQGARVYIRTSPAGMSLTFMIKSDLDDKCLIFGENGNDRFPSRHDWGQGSAFCGFPELNGMTSKASLLDNKQAVWKIEKLEGDLFMIKSAIDNKCLIFGDNGNALHPERHDWGHGGEFCGFPELNGMTSKASLLENKQAVWKIENLDATRFTIQSMLDSQRCLIFGANGGATHPERYNWGHGADLCGFPALDGMTNKDSLLDNKQASFRLELLV